MALRQVALPWPLRPRHILYSLCLLTCICGLTACWPEAATVVFVTTTATTKRPDMAAVVVGLMFAVGLFDSCHESITGRSWLTGGRYGGSYVPSSTNYSPSPAPSTGYVAAPPSEPAEHDVVDMSDPPDLTPILDMTPVVQPEDLLQSELAADGSDQNDVIEHGSGGARFDDSIEHGSGNAKFDDGIAHGSGGARFDDSIEHGSGRPKPEESKSTDNGDAKP